MVDILQARPKDESVVVGMQVQKLQEMRKAQMDFFDTKVIEFQEKNAELDAKLLELEAREIQLQELQRKLDEQSKRVILEKSELAHIKDLVRIENESIKVSTADLNNQIMKYEALLRVAMRTKSDHQQAGN